MRILWVPAWEMCNCSMTPAGLPPICRARQKCTSFHLWDKTTRGPDLVWGWSGVESWALSLAHKQPPSQFLRPDMPRPSRVSFVLETERPQGQQVWVGQREVGEVCVLDS